MNHFAVQFMFVVVCCWNNPIFMIVQLVRKKSVWLDVINYIMQGTKTIFYVCRQSHHCILDLIFCRWTILKTTTNRKISEKIRMSITRGLSLKVVVMTFVVLYSHVSTNPLLHSRQRRQTGACARAYDDATSSHVVTATSCVWRHADIASIRQCFFCEFIFF